MNSVTEFPILGRLEQHWAIVPENLEGMLQTIRSTPRVQIEGRVKSADVPARPSFTRHGKVAMLQVVGPISKAPSVWQAILGGTSTQQAEAALTAALDDPQVESVLLYVDSPGGTVAGTGDLADAVYRARAKKRVTAFCSDMAASAAYWIASQADRVVANPGALVGSIGTYATVTDWSKLYDEMGAKVHVLRAGAFKGAGTPGTEVTREQLAEFQRVVESINGLFLQAVARGRKMSTGQVSRLADGRVHIASEARALGLIDAIGTVESVLAELSQDGGKTATVASASPAAIIGQWNDAVEARMDACKCSRMDAVEHVARTRPGLHQQFLRATNPQADPGCFD